MELSGQLPQSQFESCGEEEKNVLLLQGIKLQSSIQVTILIGNKNCEFSLCFKYSRSLPWRCKGCRGIAPPFYSSILDVGKWSASCPREGTQWYPWERRLVWPQSWFSCCGEEKTLLPLPQAVQSITVLTGILNKLDVTVSACSIQKGYFSNTANHH
jgi:hypothetical protein